MTAPFRDPLRILFLSSTPPLPSWGGSMTFYRHFIEHRDFEILVATNSPHMADYQVPYQPLMFDLPEWWKRLQKTRLNPWIAGIQNLHGSWFLPRRVMEEARQFQPDAVFTIAGSWDWTALAAREAAHQLEVPLVASFNDWFDYGQIRVPPVLRKRIEARFRKFYRDADLALCTSDAMREDLGPHSNAHVLPPTGAVVSTPDGNYQPGAPTPQRPFSVFFDGSLGDWYGPMLEQLVIECSRICPDVKFRIYGSLQTWSESFDRQAKSDGTFGGRLSFPELRQQAAQADLLLLPMGFDPSSAQVERTSFKTKFLDYLAFQRPILVWGPDYCSAVRTAREYDSAQCVTSPHPAACALGLKELAADVSRRNQLMTNARRMYEDRFHPDKIHSELVKNIRETVARHPAKKGFR